MARQRIDELSGDSASKVLGDFERLHQCEPTTQSQGLREIDRAEPVRLDEQGSTLDVGAVHPEEIGDPQLAPTEQPGSIAAPHVEHRIRM